MPSYDASRFHPPAPIAPVTLRDPNTGASLPGTLMLLDIGADVTLLPRAAIERLGVSPESNRVSRDGLRQYLVCARRNAASDLPQARLRRPLYAD